MPDERLKNVPEWVWKGHLINPVDLLAIWEPDHRADLIDFTLSGWDRSRTDYLMQKLRDAVAAGECERGKNRHGKSIWWQTPEQRAATRQMWLDVEAESANDRPTAVAPEGWEFPKLTYKPPLSEYERRYMT